MHLSLIFEAEGQFWVEVRRSVARDTRSDLPRGLRYLGCRAPPTCSAVQMTYAVEQVVGRDGYRVRRLNDHQCQDGWAADSPVESGRTSADSPCD